MKQLLFAAAFASILAVPAFAEDKPKGGAAPQAAPPPPEVAYIVADTRDVPISYEFLGTMEPSSVVEVRARIRGFMDKRLFVEGAKVKEGDLLYQIDRRSFDADVESAEASVQQAEARLALADRERKRMESLIASGALSTADLDRTVAEYDVARAAIRYAKAELEKTKLARSYTDITAPLSGIIGKTTKEPGSLVDDGSNSLLTQITRVEPIYVSFSISEREYLDWRAKTKTGEITKEGEEGQQFQIVTQDGTIFPEIGKSNYEDPGFASGMGTFALRAEFPNANGYLRPGQFVKVRLIGWSRPATIVLPQRAVNQGAGGSYVYVIGAENKIEFRPVTVGEWAGNDWIIRSGVTAGEKVLVEGFMKVFPGSAVVPVLYDPAKIAAASAATTARK